MENVERLGSGVFRFTGGGQRLERLLQRTFGPTAFGPSFDTGRDLGEFVETWVWGGTSAP